MKATEGLLPSEYVHTEQEEMAPPVSFYHAFGRSSTQFETEP